MAIRLYGTAPYPCALIHGGPGAPGSMACVARILSQKLGVLEPLQSACSLDALLTEMAEQLSSAGTFPLSLIGHSWGAWLSILYAAHYPRHVRQLILIGCPPLSPSYVPRITQRRLQRLSPQKAQQYRRIVQALEDPGCNWKEPLLTQLAKLTYISDNYAPLSFDFDEEDRLNEDAKAYAAIWPQADALRARGDLLRCVQSIRIPLFVLHGQLDPHPLDGIVQPLEEMHIPFTLSLFPRCGHTPFREAYAYQSFYRSLFSILLDP